MHIETNPDSVRFKTAESELRRFNHGESRYNGAVCKLEKLSSRHRAHRTEAFRRRVLQMQLLPQSTSDRSVPQKSLANATSSQHIGPNRSAEKSCKCSFLPRAHRTEAFRRTALQMQLPPQSASGRSIPQKRSANAAFFPWP